MTILTSLPFRQNTFNLKIELLIFGESADTSSTKYVTKMPIVNLNNALDIVDKERKFDDCAGYLHLGKIVEVII